jgi:uncharacterized protein (TIGR00251 family)
MDKFFSWKDDTLFLQIHLQPRASSNKIVGLHANRLKIALTAAPIDNKANECLIAFLADYFDIRKSAVMIIKGQISRDKVVSIQANSCKNDIIIKIDQLCSRGL